MSALADALQPSLVRGIFATAGPFLEQSISELIVSRRSAFNVTFDALSRTFDLQFGDYEEVTHAIACDCRRLATSSWQTNHLAWPEDDDKTAVPWALIRLYYAAYYASHVVVRLLGEACCWLEASHLRRIDAVYSAASGAQVPFRLEPGAYRCSVDASGRVLRWHRASSGAKGAHEALWAVLDQTLRDLDARVLNGALPARSSQAVISKLEEFRQLATDNGSVSWLSRTRNEIQYRFEHGVWHASSLTKRERSEIRRLSEQWLADPMTLDMGAVRSRGLLSQFALACAFMLSTCRVLLLRVEEGSPNKSASFVRHGPRSFASFSKLQVGTVN